MKDDQEPVRVNTTDPNILDNLSDGGYKVAVDHKGFWLEKPERPTDKRTVQIAVEDYESLRAIRRYLRSNWSGHDAFLVLGKSGREITMHDAATFAIRDLLERIPRTLGGADEAAASSKK